MRVLILANNDNGLYKFRGELIEKIIRRGNEVFISLPDGDFVRPLEKMGCTFLDTPIDRRGINPKTDVKLFCSYRKMMKQIDPELVITYTIKPNIYGGIASRLTGRRYAVNITGLGTAFEKKGIIRTLVIHLYRIALKRAKIVFFENSGNRDKLLSLGCCRQEKTVVLNGAGVNTEFYGCQPYPDNDPVRFLFVGRVMKEKGVDELFDAVRLLNERGKCILDLVGPLEEDYRDKIRCHEEMGWLRYHGSQPDVRPFIAACDCFVLPSYHEGMANTNLECAASGRPIITSDIPGCKEAVIDGVSGYTCEPKDVNSLYEAMKKMLETPREQRIQMGLAGRKHMEEVFDKNKVVEETMKHLF